MSVGVTIDVKGLDALRRALDGAPARVRRHLIVALRRAGLRVEAAAKLHLRRTGGSGATGKLQQSIVTTVDEKRIEARVGPRRQIAPYAHHIELGRAPAGALPGKGPPVYIGSSLNRPFLRWLQKKVGNSRITLDAKGARLAYPFAISIKRKGWQAKPFMAPAAKAAEPQVVAEVRKGVEAALKELGRG